MMNFLHTSRKLCLTAAIYNMYLCSKTKRCSCSIHCYVSAAYNSYLFSCHNRGVIILTECLHQVVSGQILIGGKYAVGILTRNSHKFRKTCTGTDENSLKAFLIHQFINGYGLSDNHICLNGHTQLFHIFNLAADNGILRKTELRNTVGQNAARLMKSFENRYLVAHLCQIASTSQTCRAGSHNSHLMTFFLSCYLGYKTILSGPVCNKALQLSNGNRLALDTTDTLSFTLAFLRTYPSADSRKCR